MSFAEDVRKTSHNPSHIALIALRIVDACDFEGYGTDSGKNYSTVNKMLPFPKDSFPITVEEAKEALALLNTTGEKLRSRLTSQFMDERQKAVWSSALQFLLKGSLRIMENSKDGENVVIGIHDPSVTSEFDVDGFRCRIKDEINSSAFIAKLHGASAGVAGAAS